MTIDFPSLSNCSLFTYCLLLGTLTGCGGSISNPNAMATHSQAKSGINTAKLNAPRLQTLAESHDIELDPEIKESISTNQDILEIKDQFSPTHLAKRTITVPISVPATIFKKFEMQKEPTDQETQTGDEQAQTSDSEPQHPLKLVSVTKLDAEFEDDNVQTTITPTSTSSAGKTSPTGPADNEQLVLPIIDDAEQTANLELTTELSTLQPIAANTAAFAELQTTQVLAEDLAPTQNLQDSQLDPTKIKPQLLQNTLEQDLLLSNVPPTSTLASASQANVATAKLAATPSVNPNQNDCTDEIGQKMLQSINQIRSRSQTCEGEQLPAAPALTWQCKLKNVAQSHAEDMATQSFMHQMSSDGANLATRINATGYQWAAVGENIARGQATVDGVIESWLKSKEHCRNIMNPKFTQLGAGFALAKNSSDSFKYYWTQTFARENISTF